MPIPSLATNDSVLLVWATWPFIEAALDLIRHWGFDFVTGLPWVKVTSIEQSLDGTLKLSPIYGVGYWFRGCSEPLLIAKRGKSVRTQFVGLLSANARHSRKPASVYELAEQFPAPRLELFARERREGWHQVGDALDGRDVTEELSELCSIRLSGD